MRMPALTDTEKSTVTTEVFGGYNHNLEIGDGEFYDMKNLSSEHYPLLSPRPGRSFDRQLNSPQALVSRDALCWIDNQQLYISGYPMTAYMPAVNITAGQKQIVSMGAYLCIFPDGIYFNTEDYADNGYMGHENSVALGNGSTLSISLCTLDGTAITVSYTQTNQPEDAANGAYWMDTSGSVHTLKQWAESSSQWVSVPTVYLKLAANGIGQGFSKYDGIRLSGLDGNDQIRALNGSHILYDVAESYIVIVGIVDQAASITSGTVKTERKVPAMDYVTESGNRLWGCKYGVADGKTVNELYCCKLGDFRNWECYEGVATDSWRASCGTDGRWTGAATLADGPVFFKENCLHRIYPSAQGAHQVVEKKCEGVQAGSEKSLVVVNDRLYYKSRMGVCVYDGGLPTSIGSAFGNDLYYEAVAGGVRGKYYVSMRDSANRWTLFCYDTLRGLWHKEDAVHAVEFARVDDELYCLDSGNHLDCLYGSAGEQEGAVDWMAETGMMTCGLVGKKYLTRLNLRMQLPKGSSMDFWIQYDSDGQWRHSGHLEGRGLRTFLLPIRPCRCDHLQLRMTGSGDAKIYSLSRVLESGSDV